MNSVDARALSDFLVGMGMDPYIGEECALSLLDTAFMTLTVQKNNPFTADFIRSAKEALRYDISHPDGEGKFCNLLESVEKLSGIVMQLGAADSLPDVSDMNAMMDMLLTEMTPETAEILSDALGEGMISSLGISEESSKELGTMMGNLVMNMADAAPADPEQLKAEREGTEMLLNLSVNASQKLGSQSLSEVLDDDLDSFVRTVIGSDVISKTIGQAVAGGKSDPVGTFSKLSEQDKEAILSVCSGISAENQSSTTDDRLDALCSFLGIAN